MEAPPVQYVRTSDGYDIAYTVTGSGPPFVHCPPAMSHAQQLWTLPSHRHLLESIAKRFLLVNFDHRGQGLSTRGLTRPPSGAEYELDIEAVLNKLRLDDLVLFAPSFMAANGIRYAGRHPERVRALVAWNPVIERPREGPHSVGFQRFDDWQYFLHIAAATGRPQDDTNLVKRVYEQCLTAADFLIYQQATDAFRADDLTLVRVPTLVLASRSGARSMSNEADAIRLAAIIPDARLILSDGPYTGLYSPDGGVEPIVAMIEEFLAQIPGANGAAGSEQDRLSVREFQVLRLIAAGKSNPQIAGELVISLNTVQRHVSNILAKTGLENRTQAANYAHLHGLT